jgi:hypothetical protein
VGSGQDPGRETASTGRKYPKEETVEHRQFKLAALALVGLMAAAPLAADKDASGTDIQDSMEDLRSSLGSMAVQVNTMQASMANALVWGINTDLRYDYNPYKTGNTDATANGSVGMYAKRVELEATGKISSWAVWNLQFEFAGLKVEDLGVDAKGLDLLPFVAVPGYEWEAKVGLYRQPFGIENQTGSSAIPFPERAMIDGGANPFGLSKIVKERVMGVQLVNGHNYGPVGFKVQVSVADNVNDQDPANGGFGGTYTNAISYPGGVTTVATTYNATDGFGLKTDQDPTEIGRLGLDLNFIPGAKLNVGGSALHNSNDSQLMTALAAKQAWSDNVGCDFTLEVPMAQSKVWGEWVSQNSFANLPSAGHFVGRTEGWYITDTMKPLAFFNKDLSNVELSGRWERMQPNVDTTHDNGQATTIGLKYLYAGKNYTSVNYTAYGAHGDFATSGYGDNSLFSVQQQFNF